VFDIFEQPWTLLIIAIVILLVLLMIRRIFPEKYHWSQLTLPVFLTVTAFGLDFLVQTDLEKINTVISTAVKAIEQENPDAIEPIISEDYSDSYHKNKTALMRHCRRTLSEPLVEKGIIRISSIDIQGLNAIAVFTVRMVFDKRSFVYQSYKRIILAKVKIKLRKEQNKWLINQAELLELDRRPVNWGDIR